MKQLPNGISGRALALLLSAGFIGVIYFAAVAPLWNIYNADAQTLQDRRDAVLRFKNAAEDLPRLRARAIERRDQSAKVALLLNGSSDAVAAASLQSTLKDLVEEGGAKLVSAQTLPAEAKGEFRRVGVRVAFSGDLPLLATVLLGVENAHPVLAVGNLELHGGGESESKDLAIAMDVYGFRRQ